METGAADDKGAYTVSCRHIPFQCMPAASYCQACNSPESFLWPCGVLSECAGQAGGVRELMALRAGQSVTHRDFLPLHGGQLQGVFSTLSWRYLAGLVLSSPEWLMLINLSHVGVLPSPASLHSPAGYFLSSLPK